MGSTGFLPSHEPRVLSFMMILIEGTNILIGDLQLVIFICIFLDSKLVQVFVLCSDAASNSVTGFFSWFSLTRA